MSIVLITGANRGVGLELTKAYLAKGYQVIAAVRDVSKMPKIEGKVVVVKLDSGTENGASEAVKELKGKGISQFDLVIANAGINPTKNRLVDTSNADMEDVWRVNVLGPLILFRAVLPALKPTAKFVVISSGAGTINKDMKDGQGAYGHSKAAVNFIVRKLHFEHPEHVILSINPGWLPTDMGNAGAAWSGLTDGPPEKIEVAIPGIIKVIDEATRDNYSGYMTNHDGARMDF